MLESSSQAIRRVLVDSPGTTLPRRAEALALQGRHLRTFWRRRLADAPDPAAARRQGLDARARKPCEAYRQAFQCDLNHFYPGLAALQMGHILLLLAAEPTWRNLFRGDRLQADRAREDLERELPAPRRCGGGVDPTRPSAGCRLAQRIRRGAALGRHR